MRKAAPPEVVDRSSAGTNADSHAPPGEGREEFSAFICVDPGYGEQVYEHYNGELSAAQERDFAGHLLICAHCRQVLLKLKWIDDALEAGLPPEREAEPPPAPGGEESWEEKRLGNIC